MSVSGDAGVRLLGDSGEKEIEIVTNDIKKDPKKEIIRLSKQEEKRWAEMAVDEQEAMIKKLEAKKLPVRQLFQDVKAMVKAQQDTN